MNDTLNIMSTSQQNERNIIDAQYYLCRFKFSDECLFKEEYEEEEEERKNRCLRNDDDKIRTLFARVMIKPPPAYTYTLHNYSFSFVFRVPLPRSVSEYSVSVEQSYDRTFPS